MRVCLAAMIVVVFAFPLCAQSDADKQKIETLIRHVEGLKGVKFNRNGSDYDASAAARFLRGKWQSNAGDVKSAKDFIDKIATSSSTTGRVYTIRFADGKQVPSGVYLHAELNKLDGK
jgi:hypothetical protein